jgi:outer membrane protein assembly factor BamE
MLMISTRRCQAKVFRPLLLSSLLLSVLLATTGCSLIYKQPIAQGNLLEQSSVDTLSPGMSKRQVALILGTPAVQSPFRQDQWDYVYSYKNVRAKSGARDVTQIKKLRLTFNGEGQLAQIDGDFRPGGESAVFKPEDTIIEATREYQRTLRDAEKERSKSRSEQDE